MIFTLIAALAIVAPVKPTLLIVQERVLEFTDKDRNLDVMRAMAVGFETNGKVLPVIWSKGDALIATALRSGDLKKWTENPNRDDIRQVAQALRAEFFAVCKVQQRGAQLEGEIELFRTKGAKSVWSTKTGVSIVKDGKADPESGALSIASTWVAQLDTTAFKDIPASPKIENPPPANANVTQAPRIEPDKTPLANGKRAMAEGRLTEAVALLRDAVDAVPLDLDARLALIDALRVSGHPFLAADEAGRASEIMPDKPELIIAAAQSWLDGGQTDKAYENIQAALQQNANNPRALTLLADMLVGRLEFGRAIETYGKALSLKEDPEVYYKRAQAFALTEQFDKSVEDIEKANKAGLSQDQDTALRRYRENVALLEPVFSSFGAAIRNLLKEAKASPRSAEIKARAAALVQRAQNFQQYLDQVIPPPAHAKSHEQRSLAMNLLYQSAIGVQRYADDKSAETYGDADLLQIEAMREFAAAKSRFQQEVGTPRS